MFSIKEITSIGIHKSGQASRDHATMPVLSSCMVHRTMKDMILFHFFELFVKFKFDKPCNRFHVLIFNLFSFSMNSTSCDFLKKKEKINKNSNSINTNSHFQNPDICQ